MQNIATLTTAALLATAVQAVGVSCEANTLLLEDEPNDNINEEDAKTQPLCGMPQDGTRPFDRTLPADNCCRIYELKNMYGTYFEICHWPQDDVNNKDKHVAYLDSMEGSIDPETGIYTWDNEVSSWKCGKTVDIKLCYDSDGPEGSLTDCPGGVEDQETGHARSGNGEMLKNDTVSKVIISPASERDYATNGPGQVKATFFTGMNCTGISQMVESSGDGSFNVPTNGEPVHPMFTGNVSSVFFDSWTDVKLTKSNGDEDNVYLEEGTPITCLNLDYIENLETVTEVHVKYRG